MDACLGWAVGNAAFAHLSRYDGAAASQDWQVASGGWNEQHAYPIASDLVEVPNRWWYMGDIPHGRAAAELTLLLRDILFFEAGEDDNRELYLAPGVLPRWLSGDGGHSVSVSSAPTSYGATFGYTLRHDEPNRRVLIDIPNPLPAVRYVYPCRFGEVTRLIVDGIEQPSAGETSGSPRERRTPRSATANPTSTKPSQGSTLAGDGPGSSYRDTRGRGARAGACRMPRHAVTLAQLADV